MTVNEKMSAIAGAIRSKTGGTDPLTLDDMATEIPKVYDTGQTDATAAFWDAITDNGNRTFYEYAFRGSGLEYIRPRHKITPSGCRSLSMFHDCRRLKKLEKNHVDLSGVTVSASATTTGHYNTFQRCDNLEEIEDIGFPAGGYYMTFAYCAKLHTLAVLRVNADTNFTSSFNMDYALKNIVIDGVIGRNGFNVQWSPLTYDSLMSIVNALEDKTGDTSGTVWEITLGESNKLTLGQSGIKIAEEKGWVVS